MRKSRSPPQREDPVPRQSIVLIAVAALTLALSGPVSGQAAPKTAANTPTWRTITIGTYKGVERLRDDFDAAGLFIGDQADEALGRPAFPFSSETASVELVTLTAAELGFEGPDASLADILARAQRLGFELCPAEVGPLLRIQYRNQPLGESLHIAMKPVKTYAGDLIDFTVANGGAGLVLISGNRNSDFHVPVSARFVFVHPGAALAQAE